MAEDEQPRKGVPVRIGRPDLSKDEVEQELERGGLRVIRTGGDGEHPRDEASDLEDLSRLFGKKKD